MISTPVQPNFTSQTGTVYKTSIDDSIAVASRLDWVFSAHEQDTPNMTVKLEAGVLWDGVTLIEKATQNTGIITAPSSNPRIDRVVVGKWDGVVSVITGTENASPSVPAIPAGKVPICQILLDDSPVTTIITNSLLTDERIALPIHPDTVNFIGASGGGTQNIDFEAGEIAELLIDTSTTTLTFSGFPTAKVASSVLLKLWSAGSQTINWPSTSKWVGGIVPIFTDNTATFTTDFGTDDKLDISGHGFFDGDIVQASGADLPAGLAINTLYYVINKTTNDFELSLTEGGSAIDITDNGTGTHTIHSGLDLILVETSNGGLSLNLLQVGLDLT